MNDFERNWRNKLLTCKAVSENEKIVNFLSNDDLAEPAFTKSLFDLLNRDFSSSQIIDIMIGAACHYPHSELAEIKEEYERSGNLSEVHKLLQNKFLSFLVYQLPDHHDIIDEIIIRNWGLAGKLENRNIIATKIPKSGFLIEYFQEPDEKKRQLLYCHCPRIRDHLLNSSIDPVYCYCGGGFYKDIWEFITGQEVEVKLLKSIIKGDDHCQFELHITDNAKE